MPTVTVLGATSQAISLNYTNTDALLAAQALSGTITSDVQAGSLVPVNYAGGTPPTQTDGALFVNGASAPVQLPAGYSVVVDNAPGQIAIFGASGGVQRVLAGNGGLLYYFGAASAGTVVAGDGSNHITNADPSTGVIPAIGSVYNIIVGDGSNVIALESGQSTIAAGTGQNLIALGTSNSRVYAAGGTAGNQTTIIGNTAPGAVSGSGNDTIAAGAGSVSVYGGFSGIM